MEKIVALKELFELEPYSWLLDGTHCTVYALPGGMSVRDAVTNERAAYDGPVTTIDVTEIVDRFMPGGEIATLDVTVNGREFALTRLPVYPEPNLSFVVNERHRMHEDVVAEFSPTVAITV